MKTLIKSSLLGLVVMAGTAYANPAVNLNKLLSNTKAMSANFSQTTQNSGKAATFSGSMSVQRPNRFRWETKSPAEQLIVANGNTMWVYDKDLAQATRQSTNNQVGETPALLLSGNPEQIAKNFHVEQPKAGKNYYILKPKSNNANFRDLSISFNGGKPVMMVLNDNLGQTTTIRFSNVSINPALPTGHFEFTPPANTDVIEQ